MLRVAQARLGAEDLLLQGRERSSQPLTKEERRGEVLTSLVFLGTAAVVALILPWERDLDLIPASALVAAYAVAARFRFEVGVGYTNATQLVFVPMLFELPLPAVPLAVALGNVLADGWAALRSGRHSERMLIGIGDSGYALGPTLVLAAAGTQGPDPSDWPIYLAALGAQFAFDLGTTAVREWFEFGIPPSLQVRDQAWIFAVDAALSPLGLLAALLLADDSDRLWLLLPVLILLAIFAREREARVEGALELSSAYRGTALLLADVVEGSDKYTGLHSRSIVTLALAVAAKLKLDPRESQNVELGALLHDAGKISWPDSMLNKAGPLDEEEWEVVRRHTVEGEALLARVGGALKEVGKVVRASHERWDGAGYPDGLAGEEIPIASRITACCDAFHAMTSDRSYRRATTVSAAIKELQANAGTQFDPTVVRALVEVIEESEPVHPSAPPAR